MRNIFQRRGMGEDRFSHEWFCCIVRCAQQQLEEGLLADAEQTIAFASLFALERLDTDAVATSLSILTDILDKKGISMEEYLSRGRAA